MKLQKIRLFLIGISFLWLLVSTVLGGLTGAKINHNLKNNIDYNWLQSTEKVLLVSAHSHMNLMATVTILVALSLHLIWGKSGPFLYWAIWFNIIAVPMFVFGLLIKAFLINSIFVTGLISFGAIIYIISIALFAAIFIYEFFKI